ncbi:M48 family metalloprotease [Hymenobacter convexus]|uniref:M48 family metalloprotease n=1 Tax=Hymenobacter sp. CA1UV-4 TaxID=3063782 RepID=UPI0027143758|nr:M48 family metalloprotease [Hymenobacter sp. CA1UV-4]MDO7851215.1 M48 family metalloprotease [Hymenobacter sp. CA1UV-4]
MRLLFLLAVLASVLATPALAQQAPYLPFYSADTVRVHEMAVAHRAAVQKYLVTPKSVSGEYRDHYKRIAQEAADDVYNTVRYSALVDPVLNPYVQRVFGQIRQANPQLAAVQLVLSRNPEPNAHAVGNSIVMLNIGLLSRLENESQLAYVLCHELAHIQCAHMERGLHAQLTRIHSKELRKEFKRIVADEYNISSKLKELALGLSLNSNFHHRQYEKQADSLGYALLKRTSFDTRQAYRALQLLDKIDQPLSAEPLALGQYFGCANFPYPLPEAPAKPKSIFTVAAPTKTVLETTDTLKSHPDCAKRMRYLSELAQGQIADGPTAPTPEFARIVALSRLEAVQSWFDYDCYDHALYEALQLLHDEPQNAYLRSVVTLSLYELREHLLKHDFYEVVGNVSKHHPDNFNQLLTTLTAWKADDYKGLVACFAQNAPVAPAADEYAQAAAYAAAKLAAEPRATALQQQYQAQYRDGRFAKLLFPKPAASGKKSIR